MNLTKSPHKIMRAYLLGALPEPEQALLEDKYLNDDDHFEQLLAIETELADNYVRGQLNVTERRQFEQHYLAHPARRERLQFTQALLAKLDHPEIRDAGPASAPWWQRMVSLFQPDTWSLNWGTALALLLLASLAGVMYVRRQPDSLVPNIAVRTMPSLTASSPTPTTSVQPSPPPIPPSVEKTPAVFASLTLTIGSLRSTTEKQTAPLQLAAGTKTLRLQLKIRRLEYANYRVTLSTLQETEVWRKQSIKAQVHGIQETLSVQIPARRLSGNDYLVTVQGVTDKGEVEDIGKASFQIHRK